MADALSEVLNRIKDFVTSDSPDGFGMEVKCVTCGFLTYEIEDGDWLECIVSKAFDHMG